MNGINLYTTVCNYSVNSDISVDILEEVNVFDVTLYNGVVHEVIPCSKNNSSNSNSLHCFELITEQPNSIVTEEAYTHIELIGGFYGLEDAPKNNLIYGRKNAQWAEIDISSSCELQDAPNDGLVYGRKNTQWIEIDNSISIQPTDGVFTIPTGETPIGGTRCIAVNNGVAAYADCSVHNASVVGISISAAEPNTEVILITSGKITIPGASFTINSPVFVSVNGTLTSNIIDSVFSQQVGIALTEDLLLVHIYQPIIR